MKCSFKTLLPGAPSAYVTESSRLLDSAIKIFLEILAEIVPCIDCQLHGLYLRRFCEFDDES